MLHCHRPYFWGSYFGCYRGDVIGAQPIEVIKKGINVKIVRHGTQITCQVRFCSCYSSRSAPTGHRCHVK